MANYEFHSIKPVNFNEDVLFADYLKNKNLIHESASSENDPNHIPYILDYKMCSDEEWQERKNYILDRIKKKYGSNDEGYQKLSNDDPKFSTSLVYINGDELTWMNKYVEDNSPAVFLSLAMPNVVFKYEHGDGWNPPINMYCKNGEPVNRDGEKVKCSIYDVSTNSNIMSPIANSNNYKIRVNLGDNYGWCTIFVPDKNINVRNESLVDICFTKPEVVIYNKNGKNIIPLDEFYDRYMNEKKAYSEQKQLEQQEDLLISNIPKENVINTLTRNNNISYAVLIPFEKSSTGTIMVSYSNLYNINNVTYNDNLSTYDVHIGRAGNWRTVHEYSEEQGTIWQNKLQVTNREIYDALKPLQIQFELDSFTEENDEEIDEER